MTIVFNWLIGLILLVGGHRIFWLFVGCVGFIVGSQIAYDLTTFQSQWLLLAVSLAAGVIGIVMALFLQKAAILIFGFAAGGSVGLYLLTLLGISAQHWVMPAAGIGGIAGAVALHFLFDWALIVLSSLAGAMMMVRSVPIDPPVLQIVYLSLAAVGVCIQSQSIIKARKRSLRR